MSKPIVVISGPVRRDGLTYLKEHVEVRQWQEKEDMPRDILKEWLREADGLWCTRSVKVDADLVANAPKLKVIAQASVGYDNVVIQDLTDKNIPYGNTPDVLTETVAEHAFLLVVAAMRRLPEVIDFVKSGEWERRDCPHKGRDVSRLTLGIIGMGNIGISISRRARSFGMTVLYHNRTPRLDDNLYMTTYVSMETLLKESDVVLVAAPLTDETYHMINADVFKAMKKDALLVNIGRGKIVDTDALVRALETGEIAQAALDVTDPEPLPQDHPLMKNPNCLITPHIASFTDRTRKNMAFLTVENLVNGVQEKPLKTCVNQEVNYKGL